MHNNLPIVFQIKEQKLKINHKTTKVRQKQSKIKKFKRYKLYKKS